VINITCLLVHTPNIEEKWVKADYALFSATLTDRELLSSIS